MAEKKEILSRRKFLRTMGWTPFVFSSAPLFASHFRPFPGDFSSTASVPFFDFRITPHYPSKSPLDDVFRFVVPGEDEYPTEKYAHEIMRMLTTWCEALKASPPGLTELTKFIHPSVETTVLHPENETMMRSGSVIEVIYKKVSPQKVQGREQFLQQVQRYFASVARIDTAQFEIVG